MLKPVSNPDLHLSKRIDSSQLASLLQRIVGVEFEIVEDYGDLTYEKPWVCLITRDHGDFALSLSSVGAEITLDHAKEIAAELNCYIATDYGPVEEYDWELLDPNGGVTICREADVDYPEGEDGITLRGMPSSA